MRPPAVRRSRSRATALLVAILGLALSGPASGAMAHSADTTPPVIDSVRCECLDTPRTYAGIVFTATAHDDESGIASTTWTFSDGGVASGSTVGHTTSEVGPLTATATVTDGAGNTSTASTTVEVWPNLIGQTPSFSEPLVHHVRLRPGTISARGLTRGVPRRARLDFRVYGSEFGARVTVAVRGGPGKRRVVGEVDDGRHSIRLGARIGGVRLTPGSYRIVVQVGNDYGTDTSVVRLRVVR
jgi:hypothetical protein